MREIDEGFIGANPKSTAKRAYTPIRLSSDSLVSFCLFGLYFAGLEFIVSR